VRGLDVVVFDADRSEEEGNGKGGARLVRRSRSQNRRFPIETCGSCTPNRRWAAARGARGIATDNFLFVGSNFIVLTANLLVAEYLVAVSNFMLATIAALVVGKAVLVANAMPYLRRYDRAPLIQPILYKTAFYWVVVFFARLLERFVHFSLEGNPPCDFIPYLITTFSWHRFSAISLWILVLFLIYVTATEFSQLFGPGELRRLFLTYRATELQLNRRQRIRELLRLSRLMDAHSIDEFRDGTSPAHQELIDILKPLARK
jgi:hypothetical protein